MQNVDIAYILSMKAGKHLSDAYNLHKELQEKHTSKEIELISRLEAESCIESVILFQTAMEAVINEEIERHRNLSEVKKERDERLKRFRNLSFKNRWMKSYDELGMDPTIGSLADYFEFYNEYRVSITHPTSRFINIEKYNFQNVYDGIKAGWNAIEILYKKLDETHPHPSWEKFCQECNIPSL